jgi:hypothetical protein
MGLGARLQVLDHMEEGILGWMNKSLGFFKRENSSKGEALKVNKWES